MNEHYDTHFQHGTTEQEEQIWCWLVHCFGAVKALEYITNWEEESPCLEP